jgi:hypothetical protein
VLPGCSDATGAPNVPLTDISGNNGVTFATLRPVTYQLHFHGADPLNFTEQSCNENLFLASYTSRNRDYFVYPVSQNRKSDDV